MWERSRRNGWPGARVRNGLHVQLPHQSAAIGIDRTWGQPQLLADLGARQAIHHRQKDLGVRVR